jgi:hypothetical protein
MQGDAGEGAGAIAQNQIGRTCASIYPSEYDGHPKGAARLIVIAGTCSFWNESRGVDLF